MKAKKLVITGLVGLIAVGTAVGVNQAWLDDGGEIQGDAAASTAGMLVPQTGGDLPAVSDMVVDGEYDGLLPDEVLFIDGEERYDGSVPHPMDLEDVKNLDGVEATDAVTSGMMVPGFQGEVVDMVVEIE